MNDDSSCAKKTCSLPKNRTPLYPVQVIAIDVGGGEVIVTIISILGTDEPGHNTMVVLTDI